MKKIMFALCAVIMGISFSSAHACLFGSSLTDMARMSNLQTGPEIRINKKSALTNLQKEQIINALQKELHEVEVITTIKDAFNYTDEGMFSVRTVFDTLTYESYTMYLYHAGDTRCGFIYKEGTLEQVARIGDGSIHECTVKFTKYNSLPWHFTK